MRTTIDIPDDLIKDAMSVSRAKTKTRVIILGLQELIHSYRLEELRSLRGKVNLGANVSTSRKR